MHNFNLILSLFPLLGMHRKSMEAAEALKDDSGGSDRDDDHSKASDISSPGHPSNKSTPNNKSRASNANSSLASPNPSTTSNPENNNHASITPVTSTTSTSHIATSPNNTSAASAPHTPLPVHHLIESKSMLPSPNHPTFHHDNDNEAFRWVGDPISFIRCETFPFCVTQSNFYSFPYLAPLYGAQEYVTSILIHFEYFVNFFFVNYFTSYSESNVIAEKYSICLKHLFSQFLTILANFSFFLYQIEIIRLPACVQKHKSIKRAC